MEKFDRVVVKDDFIKYGETIVRAGTIGTLRDFANYDYLIQTDFINGDPKYIAIPKDYLRMATVSDLDSIENLKGCTKIMNKLYHPGTTYITRDNEALVIKGVRLALNEEGDEFIVTQYDSDSTSELLVKKYYLDNETSLLEYSADSNSTDTDSGEITGTQQHGSNIQHKHNPTHNIEIIISGYHFQLKAGTIVLPQITYNQLEEFIVAYKQLTQLMKGELL